MSSFKGKIAVVTGAGTGMGRELALQLATEGCHVAFCDVIAETMEATHKACVKAAPAGTRVTSQLCDVSDEAQLIAFRDAIAQQHQTDRIDLLFNNAGVGGTISFVIGERQDWERVFDICWRGVYYGCRVFLPMLMASESACLVNVSSVNGFWASVGPGVPHSAYCAAKFAVRGFSEALITDLKLHAPHVKVFVVMPGHIGTDIALNVRKLLGRDATMGPNELSQIRGALKRRGTPVDHLSDEELAAAIERDKTNFRDKAPMDAATASRIILDGVRADRWRILVGEDAKKLDRRVRERPEAAYDLQFYLDLAKD